MECGQSMLDQYSQYFIFISFIVGDEERNRTKKNILMYSDLTEGLFVIKKRYKAKHCAYHVQNTIITEQRLPHDNIMQHSYLLLHWWWVMYCSSVLCDSRLTWHCGRYNILIITQKICLWINYVVVGSRHCVLPVCIVNRLTQFTMILWARCNASFYSFTTSQRLVLFLNGAIVISHLNGALVLHTNTREGHGSMPVCAWARIELNRRPLWECNADWTGRRMYDADYWYPLSVTEKSHGMAVQK